MATRRYIENFPYGELFRGYRLAERRVEQRDQDMKRRKKASGCLSRSLETSLRFLE